MKNFGEIYESIKYNSSSILLTNKGLLKEFVKTIKSDKILLDEWKFYSDLLTNKEEDLKIYIQEGINHFKKYKKEDINESNKKLIKLFENVKYDSKHSLIYENIDKSLMEEGEKIDNIKAKIAIINEIHTYINENKLLNIPILKENKDINPDKTNKALKLISKKISEKYNDILDEDNKKLLSNIIKAKTKEEKSNIYESLKKECLENVNILLKENSENIKVKEKFLTLKEQLLDESFELDKYSESIKNLINKTNILKEIKEDLKN